MLIENTQEEFGEILEWKSRRVSWYVCSNRYAITGRYIQKILQQVQWSKLTWSCLLSLSTKIGTTGMPEKTEREVELLTDVDMLLMVEKEARGGLCHAIHQYVKAIAD